MGEAALTGSGESVMPTNTLAFAVTLIAAVTFVLFAAFGSVVVEFELAWLVIVPTPLAVNVSVTTAETPGARLPIVQFVPVQPPIVELELTNAAGPVTLFVSVTELAVYVASLFVTVTVNVTVSPLCAAPDGTLLIETSAVGATAVRRRFAGW